MKRKVTYIIIILVGILSSCQDDEAFKIPTDVGFQVDINRDSSTDGRLSFTQGHITIASFAFEGRREEGGDVYFENDYEQGLSISFDLNQPVDELKFQIPQGYYTRIEVALETFDDADASGLVLTGSYLNANGIRYPVRIELESSLDFELEAKDNAGNAEILLKADSPATALIKLDPTGWFATVPASYLDNAVLVQEEGESEVETGASFILISEEVNENIYDIIINRIERSTALVFQ